MKQKLLKPLTKSTKLLVVAGLCLVIGTYLLLLTLAPQIGLINSPYSATSFDKPSPAVASQEDYIFIEKLSLAVPFMPGNQKVLESGAWHRFPERGNPEKGGNFILSAHRFQMGWTPNHTQRRSPFYHIDKLAAGDTINVSYGGKKYDYVVTRKYSVKPADSQVEAPSETPKLTLYTCTLKGSADGRVVIEALPVPLQQ